MKRFLILISLICIIANANPYILEVDPHRLSEFTGECVDNAIMAKLQETQSNIELLKLLMKINTLYESCSCVWVTLWQKYSKQELLELQHNTVQWAEITGPIIKRCVDNTVTNNFQQL